MKLWAVHYADYGDDGVVGIYDTEEAAQVCLKSCEEADKRHNHYYYFIRDYTLNSKEFSI